MSEHTPGPELGGFSGRMVKAAPDLLAACEAVVRECNEVFVDPSDMSPTWVAIHQQIRAAIAKAKGQ